MKVADLKEVNEIDANIQSLLSELTTLYETRERLFKKTPTSKKSSKKNSYRLDDIDFSSLDLTLQD
jgi:hypothetical protein